MKEIYPINTQVPIWLSLPDKSLFLNTLVDFFVLLISWFLGLHCWKDDFYILENLVQKPSPGLTLDETKRGGMVLVNLHVTSDSCFAVK